MEITLPENNQTPKEIVEALDKYIVGQNDAKKAVAASVLIDFRRQATRLRDP